MLHHPTRKVGSELGLGHPLHSLKKLVPEFSS
jgi:hypothetical protein